MVPFSVRTIRDADTPVAIKLFTINLPPERLAGFADALAKLVASRRRWPRPSCRWRPACTTHTPYLATSFAEGDSLDVALKQFGPAALPDLVPRVRALAGVLDAAASRGHPARRPASARCHGVGGRDHADRVGRMANSDRSTASACPSAGPIARPNSARGGMTAAGDQFSLAALAYEWMTGRRAPSLRVRRPATWPRCLAPIARRWPPIFARALHPDPDRRFVLLRRVRHRAG